MRNILIADDSNFMRAILKSMLERAGYKVVAEAKDGEKAVKIYKGLYSTPQKIDLVLMDITMPEMDGIAALKEIKVFDNDANIVMCSSLTAHHTVVEAIKLGAKNFISKPFSEESALKIIEKVLEVSDKRKEERETIPVSKTEEVRELILSGYIKKVKLGKL